MECLNSPYSNVYKKEKSPNKGSTHHANYTSLQQRVKDTLWSIFRKYRKGVGINKGVMMMERRVGILLSPSIKYISQGLSKLSLSLLEKIFEGEKLIIFF